MESVDEAQILLVFKQGLYMKRTGSTTCGNWTSMPPRKNDFLLSRIFEQARQSNSKGGSPAEPLN